MKLLLCLECNDIYNLDYHWKTCKCGKTKGRYIDKVNAEYSGEKVVPLGFDNGSLADAIVGQPESGWGSRFMAFVIPKSCSTFINSSKEKVSMNQMHISSDFLAITQLINPLPPEFITTLDEREKTLWDIYTEKEGNISLVAEEVGISKGQVSRLIKRIFYKAEQYSQRGCHRMKKIRLLCDICVRDITLPFGTIHNVVDECDKFYTVEFESKTIHIFKLSCEVI